MNYLTLLLLLVFVVNSASAESNPALPASDPLVEAQEKLISAKGSYKTIKAQENAIESMRKATKLSLKAAKLRAKAEKLQSKADMLVSKANQTALSRGLYVASPNSPSSMTQSPPPTAPAQTAKAPSFVPVPGQPINIIVPKQEEVSYQGDTNEDLLPLP